MNNSDFYEKQTEDLTQKHADIVNKTIQDFAKQKLLPERTAKNLKIKDSKPARFYILPKVHKLKTQAGLL